MIIRSFENEWAEQDDALREEEGRLRRLELKIEDIAGHLHNMFVRSSVRYAAHEDLSADRLARMEAAVEKLSGKIHDLCEYHGLPSDHVPSICGRPSMFQFPPFPSANVQLLGPRRHTPESPGLPAHKTAQASRLSSGSLSALISANSSASPITGSNAPSARISPASLPSAHESAPGTSNMEVEQKRGHKRKASEMNKSEGPR